MSVFKRFSATTSVKVKWSKVWRFWSDTVFLGHQLMDFPNWKCNPMQWEDDSLIQLIHDQFSSFASSAPAHWKVGNLPLEVCGPIFGQKKTVAQLTLRLYLSETLTLAMPCQPFEVKEASPKEAKTSGEPWQLQWESGFASTCGVTSKILKARS